MPPEAVLLEQALPKGDVGGNVEAEMDGFGDGGRLGGLGKCRTSQERDAGGASHTDHEVPAPDRAGQRLVHFILPDITLCFQRSMCPNAKTGAAIPRSLPKPLILRCKING